MKNEELFYFRTEKAAEANAVFTVMTECHCDRAEGSKSLTCDGG